jgi:beta-N-acetylhexosaminidase
MPSPAPVASPSIAQLIGQKLVIRIERTTPSEALLGRIARGEVGGIVLFGANVTDERRLTALTATLQAAARDGGQPPLLVMTDQEGGTIRRIPWAPPAASAARMASTLDASGVHAAGAETAERLRRDGINVDLAPVDDVPASRDVFMATTARTFGSTASRVTGLATAFATGLESGGVLPVLKHFPGIGRVIRNTDSAVTTVTASRAQLDRDLAPFRAGIAAGVPLVMLSNATYDAWDPANAAGWSAVVGTSLLRHELGFDGVTITDSLAGTAKARGTTATDLAIRAAAAGTDMLLLTGPEAETAASFDDLVAAATSGAIPRSTLDASYDRIIALKAALAR